MTSLEKSHTHVALLWFRTAGRVAGVTHGVPIPNESRALDKL